MKKLLTIILCLFVAGKVFAQIEHPVKWAYAAKRAGKNEATVMLKATIEDGWHIYSAYQEPGGPVKTSFVFDVSKDYGFIGKITEPTPVTKFEQVFNMKVSYFESAVIFTQKISLKSPHPTVKGTLTFMVCNKKKCLPPEDINFEIPVK
ncbi:protein-disulfide reductase DsbD domain-containing protein [Mucilaginibacter sp. dw_454]|uniref:protein-disulfide reductase DsbD domain-containing protein n=1 Tax=Mucilaginibacter sp. dw_454 TaxID=2720079 RepID=UPI001BD498CA|nr:protein-disulfide reductase DsbD domain-containing protein [Mucilaginibacter sp. dw_454]